MDEKKTVFDYLAHVFTIFGITICILTALTLLCGEQAQQVSTIFAMGEKGIGISTIIQFFLTSVLTVMVNSLFFSDRLIRKAPLWCRTVGMLLAEVVIVVVFVAVFGWFPMDMWEPWAMFLVSFLVCFGLSVGVTVLKERTQNRKMEAALKRIRQKGAEDGNGD